jgi:TolA-binding protein
VTQVVCPDEVDDWLLYARRGTLARDDARALDAHLATCATCRLSLALGRAAGPLPHLGAEDDAMAARLVARALAPRAVAAPTSRVTRARVPRWAAVAALLALAAGAARAAVWTSRKFFAPAGGARSAAPQASIHPLLHVGAPPPVPVAGPSVPPAVSPTVVAAREPVVARRVFAPPRVSEPPRAPEPIAMPAETAATLFGAANEARRGRHLDAAARTYDVLQTRFPTSREAILSHLSLGTLALGRGDFASALAQFDAYLAAGVADLDEEALLGKARALAGLGRDAEERAAWRALEARYPTSEYRWRARQRLGELPP